MVTVYDLETLRSCITYVDINVETEEINSFVLHEELFQLEELVEHLLKIKGHVGYNNLDFDYIIIHKILLSWRRWIEGLEGGYLTYDEIIKEIYDKAQEIIHTKNTNKDKFYKELFVPYKFHYNHQLDLYKLHHYNNKNRRTSLKAVEISMNYPNVMDMPIHHSIENISIDDIINKVLIYNKNDVLATYEFYKLSLDKIELRKTLINTYNLTCLSWSDTRIGEELVLKLYCDHTKTGSDYIKNLRTVRESIDFNDLILDYVKFNSSIFSNFLEKLKTIVVTKTKDSFEESVIYKRAKYDFAQGGIHQCIEAGIYKADSENMIIDIDVTGFYPNLAISNTFYPEHLGESFITVYKKIIDLRTQAKREGNKVLSDGFKLAGNSIYGKSNDSYSFLYDFKMTLLITLNGQLSLAMLCEQLVDELDCQMLQANTDGITIQLQRNKYQQFKDICSGWESLTKLQLEEVEYSQMIIRDVNNYFSVTTDGKIKSKGCFEIDKVVGSEHAYHKDNSFRIIPIALQRYYVYNIPIKETIYNHLNNVEYDGIKNYGIYDFCGRQKFPDSVGKINKLSEDKTKLETIQLQKNVRYFVSSNGDTFIKYYHKGSTEFIHVGFKVTIFNQYYKSNNYEINFDFYIREVEKIINLLEPKQQQLL